MSTEQECEPDREPLEPRHPVLGLTYGAYRKSWAHREVLEAQARAKRNAKRREARRRQRHDAWRERHGL